MSREPESWRAILKIYTKLRNEKSNLLCEGKWGKLFIVGMKRGGKLKFYHRAGRFRAAYNKNMLLIVGNNLQFYGSTAFEANKKLEKLLKLHEREHPLRLLAENS